MKLGYRQIQTRLDHLISRMKTGEHYAAQCDGNTEYYSIADVLTWKSLAAKSDSNVRWHEVMIIANEIWRQVC